MQNFPVFNLKLTDSNIRHEENVDQNMTKILDLKTLLERGEENSEFNNLYTR